MAYRFETLQVHAGQESDSNTKASAVPVYQTAAYQFDSAKHAADLFALKAFGNIYSRIMNPTNAALEARVAALEGGTAALALASGHAAVFAALVTIAGQGDNIVASPNLYGGTFNLLSHSLPRLGITARFTSPDERPEEFAALIDENTKAVFLETIGNPSLKVPDFEAIAAVAKAKGVAVIVDNTFGIGGFLFRPLEHGANIVVHSATKWIGGHGSSIGGLLIDGGNFAWDNGRYPEFTEPSASYHGLRFYPTFGNITFAIRARVENLRDFGASLAPQNAFLFLQGIETLSLRAERHVENTLKVARFLEGHEHVSGVSYPGLESHPSYETARKYLTRGAGAVLTFELRGGRAAGEAFVNSVKLATLLANVGDTRTLVIHPASTTHSQLSEAEQAAAGVTPGQVRVSVGLEHIDDILEDLNAAIEAAHETALAAD
ncbi:MAG TPA: aminotransferase class V-fold PLP-dependent enzyme [Deinococcales bacterium]|nr:aminotransferase class V-fold PLP-dependent enzyme [Deinococcales bacterium]